MSIWSLEKGIVSVIESPCDVNGRGFSNEKAISKAFEKANQYIKIYQKRNIPRIDYLAKDYPGCTAALAYHNKKENIIYWGFISYFSFKIF